MLLKIVWLSLWFEFNANTSLSMAPSEQFDGDCHVDSAVVSAINVCWGTVVQVTATTAPPLVWQFFFFSFPLIFYCVIYFGELFLLCQLELKYDDFNGRFWVNLFFMCLLCVAGFMWGVWSSHSFLLFLISLSSSHTHTHLLLSLSLSHSLVFLFLSHTYTVYNVGCKKKRLRTY